VTCLWALTMLAMWAQRRRTAGASALKGEEEAAAGEEKRAELEKEDSEGSLKSAYAITAATTDLDGNLVGH